MEDIIKNRIDEWRKNTSAILDLSKCKLTDLEDGLKLLSPDELLKIRNLNCSQNNLTDITLLERFNLSELDCSYNMVGRIPLILSLVTINAKSNNLTVLVTYPKLKWCDVSNNAIQELPNLPNCVYLDCCDNLIHDLSPANLPSIKTLYFMNNLVTNVPNFKGIKELACEGNPINTYAKGMKSICQSHSSSSPIDPDKMILRTTAEILSVIDVGSFLVRHLVRNGLRKDLICKFLDVKTGKMLGKGQSGTVNLVTLALPGESEKEYALKREYLTETFSRRGESVFQPETQDYIVEDEYLFKYLPMIAGGQKLIACRTKHPKKYKKLKSTGFTLIPAASYICENNSFSEFAIGLMLGDLYNNDRCANFISMLTFATCEKSSKAQNLTLMHKIDSTFKGMIKCIDQKDTPSSVIQLLSAIHIYQSLYQISHNDLHTDNIFIEYINENTVFNGERLIDADYFHYSFPVNNKTVDIYIPFTPFLIKIGDFGLSFKWSEPMIGDLTSLGGYFNGRDYYTPNWYSPQFDVMYSLYHILYMYSISGQGTETFLDGLFKRAIGDNYGHYYNMNVLRPHLDKLEDSKAKRMAPSSIFDIKTRILPKVYFKKPTTGKIVTLGRI